MTEIGSGAILTVSQLLLRATNALVSELGSVVVEGEVSSFHHARGSGHMYWTLKDGASEVRCVMFRSDNYRLRQTPVDGTSVVVVARPTIYPSRGQFQLQVTELLARGRGVLHERFEALRKKLADEGVFDAERKRALPFWPRRVGVVTSAEGAAVRDIITVIRRRAAATEIVLKPVPVQGRDAAPEIARAIHWFSTHLEAEVLIVGRGGGSLEDLWAFNEEEVVRAISSSVVPVVSAVGHETDTTLSDFAADVRAPTPSAAAERVVPEIRELRGVLDTRTQRLCGAVVRQRRRRVDEALAPIQRYGFRRVRDRWLQTRQVWGDGVDALSAPVASRWSACRSIQMRARGLGRLAARHVERPTSRFVHLERRLHAVSPLAILDRGYAIVTDSERRVARDAARFETGARIAVRLAKGRLKARVEDIEPGAEEVIP